jgi:hypothetical protein
MAIVMGVVVVPTCPRECIISRTVHHATVIQMVKQAVQLFRERYIET